MSANREDHVILCQKAIGLVNELCDKNILEQERCLDFVLHSSDQSPSVTETDLSVSLLAVILIFCGLALVAVFLFVFWKLCWVPWKNKVLSNTSLPGDTVNVTGTDCDKEMTDKPKESTSMSFLEAAMKISHTSPDIPAEVQMSMRDHILRHTRIQRQTTEPTSSSRHSSFKRHLPRQMHVSSVDFSTDSIPQKEQATSIGRIKPELYKQKSVDSEDTKKENGKTCGKINFMLKYDYENEMLIVTILKAFDLPAKDFCGSSDPYVKIYLLPDRKRKFQTRVHRKTLNPTFDESFQFPVSYDELTNRKLHLSVYDFDRFSRHDMIGEVILENLFEISDLSRDTSIWKDIQYATTESVDLGEIMFSLCYLPTAGRLTLTVIKCRNLKAMDITGFSDPYVKVSLLCEGRRLKKKKTTIKKNTLNPSYNEAIIFDIPPENMDQVSLLISVMDYDRVGHNEIIGVCRVGINAEGLGRDHWNEMLAYPRKPIAHWHPLVEAVGEAALAGEGSGCEGYSGTSCTLLWQGRAASFDSQVSCPSPKPPATP
ncbi:synaptotagmin-6-like isoform X1 [Scyliorhinus canicula]|uniref:synaptotagmin-6-like isoform X1 n=1 Tax=Scyliorhinus canicula TaxID=7830 RepID=UPI0018F321E6|nr:synaptotagmin-6-like isoform X1 [Scyliorhinus canicula]